MVSLSYFLIALLCTLPFLLFLKKWRGSNSGKTPPPSPPKLPVIGNLHQLGLYPHRYLQSLSRRYGPLMQLHFGSVPVVVASSPEAARELMKNQDIVFSNRPKMSIANRLFFNNRDVAFTQYGEYWRQIRSICVLQLLSNKRVQSFRRVREEETSTMVEKIMQLGSSSTTVNLSKLLLSLTNDVICRVTLGEKYGGGNESEEVNKLKEMLTEFQNLLGIQPLWECIPWLSWTRRFDGVDKRIDRVVKAFDEFLESVIQQHKDKERDLDLDQDKDGDGDGGLDFVDILLQFQRENKTRFSVEDDTVKALILDMFVAGTDTTATALEWAIAELIKNPRAMIRLQNEVRQVAGSKAEIEEEDLEKMPYLKASIKESLRLHPPVVLLVPRESTRDTNALGYDIASGTRVLINVWAIGRDPSVWENPQQFLPERFLDSSIDYRGMHFELLPFGAGRRGCAGITFAVAIDELALAKLVHKFDFSLPDGATMEDLDMSETSGLTVHKKSPLLLLPTPHHAP